MNHEMQELMRAQRFKTRRKINLELMKEYELDVRFHGDKNIKNDLAQAKRTATALAKASSAFPHLPSDSKQAMEVAAVAMRRLAADLAELAAWAKDYGAFCAEEREKERVAELEAFAQSRWGSDEKAMAFEAELLAELDARQGGEAFGDWMHSQGKHEDVSRDEFTIFFGARPEARDSLRLKTAWVLRDLERARPEKSKSYKGALHYYAGARDYEEYLAWRKAAAEKNEKITP